MKHKHLTLQDRYYIEISLRNGDTQTAIAKSLGTIQDDFIKLSYDYDYDTIGSQS